MRVVIVGASPEAYWDCRFRPDIVLCADGGLQRAHVLGLQPDMLIGDGDSGGVAKGIPCLCLPSEKEESDMQACVRYALEQGGRELVLLGATGGRLDHFMANVGLLEYCAAQGAAAAILDRDNELSLYREPLCWEAPHGYRYFSLVPLDAVCEGVYISGAKYPLENATLRRCDSRAVSNEPACPRAAVRISVRTGAALLIRSGNHEPSP